MPRSRSVQLLLMLSAALLIAAAALVWTGTLGFWVAARALAFTTVLLTALVLALLARRMNRQIHELRAGLDRNVRLIREITGEQRAEIFGRTQEIAERLTAMEEALHGEADTRARGESETDPKVHA